MKTEPRIFGTGLIALDVIFGLEDPTSPFYRAGGTCGNVMAILSFLGWSAFPIGRFAKNSISERIKEDFLKWGVRWDFMECSPLATAPVVVQRIKKRKDGTIVHRFSFTCPHCGEWLPSYRPIHTRSAEEVAPRISSATVFFLDRLSKGNLHLAREACSKGAIVFYEPNGRADEKLEREALSIAHILKYSSERIREIDANDSSSILLEVETLGEKGLRYRSRLSASHSRRWHEMLPVAVANLKDAAGAGDWCTAGIINTLARGGLAALNRVDDQQLKEGIHFAQVLAAWNCRFEGARGGMYKVTARQFKAEIDALLAGSTIQVETDDEPSAVEMGSMTDLCSRCKPPLIPKKKARR